MLAGIGTCCQFAFCCGFGKHTGIKNESIYRINSQVEIIFNFIEITIIAVSDLGRNITFTDPVNIFSGHVQRTDNRIEAIINPLDDVFEIALVLTGISTCSKLTFYGSL